MKALRGLGIFLSFFVFSVQTNIAQSPGGVSSNLYLWLKASTGVTQSSNQVTAWANQASTSMTTQASYATASANILLSSNNINFNPAIVYNGSSGYCLQGKYTTAPTNAATIFAAAIGQTTGGSAYGNTYSNSGAGSYGMDWAGASGSGTLGTYNIDGAGVDCSSTAVATNLASVVRAYYPSTSTVTNAYIALNGIASAVCSQSNGITAPDGNFQIGGRTWGSLPSRIFTGSLSEVIYFNTNTLTATQINQVESYLALKYGVTLGNTSTLINYTSSTGTVFWTGSSSYQNDVFGIGTDNGSGLTQTQSNSMNNGSGSGVGQIGKGNLVITAPSALPNQQFLMIGDDAGALTEQITNLPASASGSKRVVRNWLVQSTGSVGTVNLSFDMTGLTLTGGTTASNYRLLVNSNTDASFATGAPTYYNASSIVGNLINFTGISLTNNTVFTIISNYSYGTVYPGGVNTGLLLWNKANAGISTSGSNVTAWVDQTANNTFTVSGTPVLQTNTINFNPDILFNGSCVFTGNTSLTNITEGYAVAKIVNNAGTNVSGAVIGNTVNAGYNYFFHTEGGYLYTSGGASTYSSTNFYGNNVPYCIMNADHSETPAAGSKIKINGVAQTNIANGDPVAYSAIPLIGARTSEDLLSGGEIAEAILYNQSQAGTNRSKIISYLALKYGISLGNTSNLVNYISSNGTVFWSGNSTYQNDVFGIGTDNGAGLVQAESNSMNNGSGNGTGQSGKGNLILSNSGLADQQFLMIGDDAGALTEETSNLPTGTTGSKRVVRNWLVQNTGSVGAVNLSFDMTGLTLSGGTTATNYRLLENSNTDATFATGAPTHYFPSSITGNLINFSNINLQNNTVFTLVTLAAGTTLPATWISFTATKQGNGAMLNWTTSDEVNVANYEVAQSANGISYSSIGRVAANNMPSNNYSFQVNTLTNGSNYFRIKRVDLNGVSDYSSVKEIKNSLQFLVSIQPNPVMSNQVNVNIGSPMQGQADLSIFSMDGRLLIHKSMTIQDGLTIVGLDISKLAAGTYITRVLTGNNLVTEKFIKQ
ncbi:MAG: T9SS type A sorting domain-containing protein [Bacteroidetes bacterium]|nr:T9SS type A sorting domain-containing protein [Bacteroidota bacterium]